MELIGLLISLASGAVGGNVAGKLLKSKLGFLGRSVAGIIGGTALSQLAPMIPTFSDIFADPMSGVYSTSEILASVISGVAGGAILTFMIGMFSSKV